MVPKLVMFDLDGTLAESKQPLTSGMAGLLTKLLARTKVAIISGGALPQFIEQVVEQLPLNASLLHLYLLPTSGAALYEWSGDHSKGLGAGWHKIYEERLSQKETEEIERAMREAAKETGLIDFSTTSFGERIEYRGGQVSLSALGQEAPVALKREWDPDKAKRRALQRAIASRLPGYAVGMGGMTTIDVNKHGVDKAYGIHQLCERLHISEKDALYVGDQLVEGGNDEAVFRTSAATHAVFTLEDTEALIRALLAGA
ncbi:MAG: HAD-IIB family hydrolase [bacterium]|nr:HAD-IIB family hydrolase [bacterium]